MWSNLSAFFLLFMVTNGLTLEEKWYSFKLQYGRSYNNPKIEQIRYNIFKENLQIIESHNEQYEQGLVSYKMSVNKFTDLSQREFIINNNNFMMGLNATKINATRNKEFLLPIGAMVPENINWVDLGAVTEVKNQGSSGSSASFGVTGAIESQYFLKSGKLISLSEQNIADCAVGCHGRDIIDCAFQYVCDNGIMSEADYPSYAANDGICHFDPTKSVVKAKSIIDIKSGSENDLKEAVGTIGPFAVGVDATKLQSYGSGIFDDKNCLNDYDHINHAMLAVGYGSSDGKDYWLVKNSWGTNWGENGYIRISRNNGNLCGIATMASCAVL